MSRSNKARHGTKTKQWKDSVGRSRSQAKSRAKWKRATKKSPKKTMGSRKPQKPIAYEDETGLFTPMRLAVMTGKKPSDFKNTAGD